jgi:hypothetical protein
MAIPGVEFSVDRSPPKGVLPLTRVFKGLESSPALKRVFGPRVRGELAKARVCVIDDDGYMHVSDEDGCVMVSRAYLRQADEAHLYLDIVHELVHVKQFRRGRLLFDPRFEYGDRPTEREAYRAVAREARRMGLSERETAEFIHTEWMSRAEYARLLRHCGIRRVPKFGGDRKMREAFDAAFREAIEKSGRTMRQWNAILEKARAWRMMHFERSRLLQEKFGLDEDTANMVAWNYRKR